MKTTRKRKPAKATRKTARTTAARFMQDNAGQALRRGRKSLGRVYDWAHEAGAGAHLGALRMPRRSDITHLTEANPLLLGAVGLGLGVAIGSLFPHAMRRTSTARNPRSGNGTAAAPVKVARRRKAAVSSTSAG